MSLATAPNPRGGGHRQGSKRGHHSARPFVQNTEESSFVSTQATDPAEAERLAALYAKYPRELDYLKSLAQNLDSSWKDEDLLAMLEDCLGDEEKAADRLLSANKEEGFQWTDVRKIKKDAAPPRKEASAGAGGFSGNHTGNHRDAIPNGGKPASRARSTSESRGGSRGGRGGSFRGESRGGSARVPRGAGVAGSKPSFKDAAKGSSNETEDGKNSNAEVGWGDSTKAAEEPAPEKAWGTDATADASKATEDGRGTPSTGGWATQPTNKESSPQAVLHTQPSPQAHPSRPVTKGMTWSQIASIKVPEPTPAPKPVEPKPAPQPPVEKSVAAPLPSTGATTGADLVNEEPPTSLENEEVAQPEQIEDTPVESNTHEQLVEETVESLPQQVEAEEPEPISQPVLSPPQPIVQQAERKSPVAPIGSTSAPKSATPSVNVAVSLPPRQSTPIRRAPAKQDAAVIMPPIGLGSIGLKFGNIKIGGEDAPTNFGSDLAQPSEEVPIAQTGVVAKPIDQITGAGVTASLTPIISSTTISAPSQGNEIAAHVQPQPAVASPLSPVVQQPVSVQPVQPVQSSPHQQTATIPQSQPVTQQAAAQPQQSQPVQQSHLPQSAVGSTIPVGLNTAAPAAPVAATGFGMYQSYQAPVAPYSMGMPVPDYLYGGAPAPDAIRGQQALVGASFPPGMPVKPYYDPYQQQSGVANSFIQPRIGADGSKFSNQEQQAASQFHQPGLSSSSHPQQAAVAPQHQHQHQPQGPGGFPPSVNPYYGAYYPGYGYPQNPYGAYGASQAPAGYGYGPHAVAMNKSMYSYPPSNTAGAKPTPGVQSGSYGYPNPGGPNSGYMSGGAPPSSQVQPASPAGQGLYEDSTGGASAGHGPNIGGIHHVGGSAGTNNADYGKQSIYSGQQSVGATNAGSAVSNQGNASFPFGISAGPSGGSKGQDSYKSQIQNYDKQGYNSLPSSGAGVAPSNYYGQQTVPQVASSMPSSSGYQGPYHQGVPGHVMPHGQAGAAYGRGNVYWHA